jgi:hypothetical protein
VASESGPFAPMIPRTPSGILSPTAIVIDIYFQFGIE